MGFVRTVLGDVAVDGLGPCLAHEHVIIDPGFVTFREPEARLDDVGAAAAELARVAAAGGGAVVEATPCDSGRNVLKLVEASRRARVRVVAATGLHLARRYDPGHWSGYYTVEQMAALFVADVREGIDANDYSGPIVVRTRHRAGVVKAASGLDRVDDHERRVFEAAAMTHRVTGCPILTHCEQGTAGLEQVALLDRLGADLRQVLLCHTDRRPDPGYHRELLQAGVCLSYDALLRHPPGPDHPSLRLAAQLLPEFPQQIVFGTDAGRRTLWRSYGSSRGPDWALTDFGPALMAAGVPAGLVERAFRANPAAVLAFRAGPGADAGPVLAPESFEAPPEPDGGTCETGRGAGGDRGDGR